MLSQSFHVITEKSPIADDFARALRRVGLSPVFFSLRKMLSEQLTPLGIATPHVFEKGIEVYTSSDQKKAVLARSGRDDQAGRHVWFVDFVVLSREAPFELLVRAIEENLELEVLDHSYPESLLIRDVRSLITATSPNGKLLEQVEIQNAAKELRDDSIRRRVKDLCNTFGAASAERSEIEKLQSFQGVLSVVDSLISSGVLVPTFQIYCRGCLAPHLEYPTRAEAEDALQSSGRCACGEKKLSIGQNLCVSQKHVQCLQQGVWLEALISEAIKSRTSAVWAGRMLGSDEVDVVSVIAGRVVLVECKDKAVGQNDLYIAAIKAQRLKADFVVVISTRDISVNVQERIADFNAQRRNGDDRFVAITSPSASELERQLLNLLDEWTEQHVQNWLIGSRDLFYFGTEP